MGGVGQALPMGDISAAEIIFDPAGENLELTPHFGAINLRMEDTINAVQVEGWGDSEVDGVFGGTVMELEIPCTRSDYEKLQKILLGELVEADKTVKLVAKSGCAMYDNAKLLYIKPECDGVANPDTSTWIQLFHVHPYRRWELTYDRSTQRTFMVGCKIFISHISGQQGEFGKVGVAP